MANLTAASSLDNVYQIEEDDYVLGGPGQTANLQAQQLLNRTKYLQDLITSLDGSGGPFDHSASGGALPTTGSAVGGGVKRKDTYKISVAGTISGVVLQVGDTLIAKVDGASTIANFIVLQNNVDLATSSVLGLIKLVQDLTGGSAADAVLSVAGFLTVLGNRTYTDQQVLTNGESLTTSLNKLDQSFGYRDTTADLNSVTQPGVYHIKRTNVHAPAGINTDVTPNNSRGAIMIVTKDVVSGGIATMLRQSVRDLAHGAEWYREQNIAVGTWSAWVLFRLAKVKFYAAANWNMDTDNTFLVPWTDSELISETSNDLFNDIAVITATAKVVPTIGTQFKFQLLGDNIGSIKHDNSNITFTRKLSGTMDSSSFTAMEIEITVTYRPTM